MLSDDERKRYERQIMIEGWGVSGQEKLKKAVVFVAGAGGLGSSAVTYLAAAGVGHLRLCDFDSVEPGNLNRQILHDHTRLGVNKAVSAAKTLERINPHVEAAVLTEKITPDNADRLMAGADILLDCLDNYETRFLLNQVSVRKSVPLIFASVRAAGGMLSFIYPPQTPCFACMFPEGPARKEKFPVVGAAPGVIGTLQAMEAIKFLTGIGSTLQGRLLVWDGGRMEFKTYQIPRDSHCAVCGAVAA